MLQKSFTVDFKNGLAEINNKRLERNAKRESIAAFMHTLGYREDFLTEFYEDLWICTVERVMIHSEHEITFVFKNGLELNWDM